MQNAPTTDPTLNPTLIPTSTTPGSIEPLRHLPIADNRIARFVLLQIGLAMMFGGQLLIFRGQSDALDSTNVLLIPIGLALVLFVLGRTTVLQQDISDAPRNPDAVYTEPFRLRWRWLALAVGLTVYLCLRAVEYPQKAHLIEYLLLWFGVMVALVLMVLPRPGQPYAPDTQPIRHREWALIGVILILAALPRLTDLGTIPYLFDQDEAKFAQEGLDLFQGGFKENPFGPGIDSHPRTYTMQIALAIAAFGNTVAAARFPAAVAGTLLVVATYLLGREIYGWRVGLVAAFFSVPWVLHVFFSKQGLNQPFDPLFAALAFFFLLRGLRRHALVDFALSGIFLGHAQLYYLGGRVAPLVMVAYLVYQWLRDRDKNASAGPQVLTGQWRALLLIPLTAFIVTLPHHFHLVYYHQPISTRADKNIFLGGEFQDMTKHGRDAMIEYVRRQVFDTFNGLYVKSDRSGWIGPGSPVMGPFGGPLLLIGVIVTLLTLWRRPRWCIPLGWAFAIIFVTGVLGTIPPFYERFYPAVVALALLVGVGVETVGVAVGSALGRPGLTHRVMIGGALFLLVAGTLFYYLDFLPARQYIANRPNYYANLALHEATALVDRGRFVILLAQWESELFDADVIRYPLEGRPYYMTEDAVTKFPAWTLDPAANALPLSFVLSQTRRDDLSYLQATFPGGRTRPVMLPQDGTLALYIYDAPSPAPLKATPAP